MIESSNDDRVPVELLPISEEDIAAYVEDRLDGPARVKIEGFLACNPDLAATVMHALHSRERSVATRRINRAKASKAPRMARIVAACLACGVAGWAVAEGLDDEGPFEDLSFTPEYVEDAVMSLRVAHMRSAMNSQIETPKLDSEEIEQATRIRMPSFPVSWHLVDTQIFPSEDGPSVSVFIETSPGHRVNFFAVRADTRMNETPVITTEDGTNAAYWEKDGAAYVLTADGPPGNLLAQANQLSTSN